MREYRQLMRHLAVMRDAGWTEAAARDSVLETLDDVVCAEMVERACKEVFKQAQPQQ